MLAEEVRPLKRPKLGVPDFYPQEDRQREDELSISALNLGFRQAPPFNDEIGSARQEMMHILRSGDFTSRINLITETKKRTSWGHDSQKRRSHLSRENFWLVPGGRNKKEVAAAWFNDLAGTKPISTLAKRVPIFNKREEIFEVLFEKDVAVFRAVWYIKMTAAHSFIGSDSKLTKKKQLADPSFEWTVALTKYMQECVWRICSDSPLRHEHRSSSMAGSGSVSQEDNASTELSRWRYMMDLSSWLYQENLLDRQEFLRWLVEMIETTKASDDRLILYLPLAIKYLMDISECVFLARPLVYFCCQRLVTVYDLQQRVAASFALKKPHPLSLGTQAQESIEMTEDDDVFSNTPGGMAAPRRRDSAAARRSAMEDIKIKQEDEPRHVRKRTHSTSLAGGGPPQSGVCNHHVALLSQLCSIVQVLALKCPMAFIKVSISKGNLGRDSIMKASTSLDKLPIPLPDLPATKKIRVEEQRKLRSALAAAANEIRRRARAAESGWSAVAVADLQTSTKGSVVKQVLKLLEVLDGHSFTTSKSFSPLSILYAKIFDAQKHAEVSLSADSLCMLLCQWAVTSHRHGEHRPLAVARILRQLQTDLPPQYHQHVPQQFWERPINLEQLDESWDQLPATEGPLFPFQSTLFQFLDSRAPLPSDLSQPLKCGEPFLLLLSLYSGLIRLHVFSYSLYLSTLVARGETNFPIIPSLPFANEETTPACDQDIQLKIGISLQALPPNIFNGSPQKKLLLPLKPDQTISPSLPDQFTSQGQLLSLTGLDAFDTFSQEEDEEEEEEDDGVAIKVEENSAMLMERQQKLLKLMESPPLAFPLSFPSSTQDSPQSPNKTDVFNFSPPILDTSSVDDSSPNAPTIDKRNSRHLIFAAYFPLEQSEVTQQELNERLAVLCGTGKARKKVDAIVGEIRDKVEHHFRLLKQVSSPVLPDQLLQVIQQFRMLPTFYQNQIACSCAQSLLSSLTPSSPYPSCSQLVFICQLFSVAGSIQQIVELLVDVIACDGAERREGVIEKRQSFPHLPSELCFPVVNLLWFYTPSLLLSLHDTSVVFECLLHVLDGLHKPLDITPAQRSVFLLLYHLDSSCVYVQRTYRVQFSSYRHKFSNLVTDVCSPSCTDIALMTTNLPALLAVSTDFHIFQVVNFLHQSPKNSFYFACEVFSMAVNKHTTLQKLCDLAYVCAYICCACTSSVSADLLGAFRALCIPGTTFKACKTGFTDLTNRTHSLSDTSIHSNLVSFVGLLLAYNCFTLQDIIMFIVRPIFKVYLLYPQGTGNSQQGSISLEFVSLLVRHLLVDEYIQGLHGDEYRYTRPILHPSFVCQFLLAKCRELSFDMIITLLKDLLKICKDMLVSSRGTTFGSAKTGMSILVESFPSGSEGNEEILEELRRTLELLASQSWVREKCSRQTTKQLLEVDCLGDTSLTPPQAQYLLNLLIPYCVDDTAKNIIDPDGSLPQHIMDPNTAVERILKNLDQWTLHNSLLHLDVLINQVQKTMMHHNVLLLDHLAQCVIQVFEDSCGDEWLGQTIISSSEDADGAFSPSIWLVSPLVSKLTKHVLGRILKSAGNVLGRGQWWNPERSQEKRRATRATSGIPQPKTGLQWQQPFLELVLACMHSHHTNHDELLGPLQRQLTTFLGAFEKEGMPNDEQNRTMLYAALKLRLSLVGSMLVSIASSEISILEWVALLMQLICSGAVDRQPDNSELFTNCMDMLGALLQTLPFEFHTCLVSGGEDGKKSHSSCIKKMKMDLSVSKSSCKREIQQLFSLPQKAYDVTIVKPPSFIQSTRGNEKVQGLRIQDTKEISPWEILEEIRNTGPLQLSWFGAVRMKRKPLKFQDQWRQVQFHTHQRNTERMCAGAHYVSLPEVPPAEDIDQSASGSGAQVVVKQEAEKNVRASGGEVPTTTIQMMQARSSLSAGTGNMIAGNPNITTAISSGSTGMLPSSNTMRQQQGMQQQQQQQHGVTTSDHRHQMTLLEQRMRDENRRMMMANVSTGISPLPPQFNQTSIPQQAQSQVGQPGMPPHQVMPQQQPNIRTTMSMYPQSQQPMQQSQQQQQIQVLANYFTPQQKKQFGSLSTEQKRMVMLEARQRMVQHMQQVRMSQQQPQHQPQRIMSRPQQMMQFRQPMPQSGPLHANPPMPMQQIIQQRQHGFPGHPHPGVPGPGQPYMIRQSMYQQPGGSMPFPRPQHNMHPHFQ